MYLIHDSDTLILPHTFQTNYFTFVQLCYIIYKCSIRSYSYGYTYVLIVMGTHTFVKLWVYIRSYSYGYKYVLIVMGIHTFL